MAGHAQGEKLWAPFVHNLFSPIDLAIKELLRKSHFRFEFRTVIKPLIGHAPAERESSSAPDIASGSTLARGG